MGLQGRPTQVSLRWRLDSSNEVSEDPGAVHDVTSIVTGWKFTCVVRADTTVWCWGRNDHGQLGDGTTTDRHTPVRVQDQL
jgi:alpha-tubulin suppressor-like RCC1 family protein